MIAISAYYHALDAEMEVQWRVGRQIAFYAIAPHTKRRMRSPSQLFSLPWDGKGITRDKSRTDPAFIPVEKKALLAKLFALADKREQQKT